MALGAALLVAVAACSREPHHPDWVIHCSIEIVGPPPAGGYRLIFPYIVGDFYGSPNTGAFVAPVSRTSGGFTLDLNRTQGALESELGPTDFRAARIEGAVTRGGNAFRYDIRVAKPGYVWIGAIRTGGHDTLYTTVPPPRQPMLTITTKR
jgi:hypothetical protein